ncbi:MAG: hypothetical protein J0L92_30030 [Deltaproteobacteria bacterium]|nr:hypothetical protein [Deltaproteobacteria bacterium]
MHPDQQPFADFIWDQTQYPEEGWENHTIGNDPVALAMLDALDHWRRNQDSEAAIELLERAITTLRWYQGVPPKHATSQTSGGT